MYILQAVCIKTLGKLYLACSKLKILILSLKLQKRGNFVPPSMRLVWFWTLYYKYMICLFFFFFFFCWWRRVSIVKPVESQTLPIVIRSVHCEARRPNPLCLASLAKRIMQPGPLPAQLPRTWGDILKVINSGQISIIGSSSLFILNLWY